jgi:CheY-like chemotaxis protein
MPDSTAGSTAVTAPQPLKDLHILVVEDEMMAATMVEIILGDAGGRVVGPVASVAEGLALAESEAIDAAILDVNLGGEFVYPLADALAARRVPFVFVTGYGMTGVNGKRYAGVPVVQKPYDDEMLVRTIAGQIAACRFR